MRYLFLLCAFLLTACMASVAETAHREEQVTPPGMEYLTQSGTVFSGKFATTAALNSMRVFSADYHGDMRFTLYDNYRVTCSFSLSGRITDPSIYDGPYGFIDAYSTLCSGRLQQDGSFEFQGAYITKGPDAPAQEGTHTLRGVLKGETLTGDLLLKSPLGSEEGVAFEVSVFTKTY